jgi:hypothetical protein
MLLETPTAGTSKALPFLLIQDASDSTPSTKPPLLCRLQPTVPPIKPPSMSYAAKLVVVTVTGVAVVELISSLFGSLWPHAQPPSIPM